MRNDNNLFFLCSLIEFIGREQKLPRSNVVEYLGNETLRRIYNHADVLHCEPIAAVAAQYIELCEIPAGRFDNYNSDFYYQSRDYVAACYQAGEVLEA